MTITKSMLPCGINSCTRYERLERNLGILKTIKWKGRGGLKGKCCTSLCYYYGIYVIVCVANVILL